MRLIPLSIAAFLFACAYTPKSTKYDEKWEFLITPSGKPKACIDMPLSLEIREIILKCKRP